MNEKKEVTLTIQEAKNGYIVTGPNGTFITEGKTEYNIKEVLWEAMNPKERKTEREI